MAAVHACAVLILRVPLSRLQVPVLGAYAKTEASHQMCSVLILRVQSFRLQVPVLEAYAMTEASHQMCSNPLPSVGPRKPGTVGPAQGGVKVAILDLQNRCKTLAAAVSSDVFDVF